MDKLKMHTPNKANENFAKLAQLFPNAVTETIDADGNVVRAIDKDVLMQEISCAVVEGNEERYQFTWPDKKKSILLANAPIAKTLRPCREESVDFDTTENLYIEGDNLDVLKLLQESQQKQEEKANKGGRVVSKKKKTSSATKKKTVKKKEA